MIITDPLHAELRSAINIKNALDNIRRLPQLGYCPTKVQQFRDKFKLDDRDDSHNGDFGRSSTTEKSPERRFKTRDLANQVCQCEKNPDSGLWSAPNGLCRPSLMTLGACIKI